MSKGDWFFGLFLAALGGALFTALYLACRPEGGMYEQGVLDAIAILYWMAWVFLLGRTVGKE